MPLRSYRELEVWKRAVDLVESVYRLTSGWPESEKFGLTNQARRAATSIPANIAEGYGRAHPKEYQQDLAYARGSLLELETHIIVAGRLGFMPKSSVRPTWAMCQEVGKMLRAQLGALQNRG